MLEAMQYTPQTKTNNEVAWYYNLDNGLVKKKLFANDGVGDSSDVTPCGGSVSCPAGSFDATVLKAVMTPNGRNSAFGDMPADAPMFTAVAGEHLPTEDGVFADLVCLPDPLNDVLICYDQTMEANLGATYRAVARKYDQADHYVLQRGENTVRVTDFFVSSWKGLSRLRGRRVTLIAKVYPAGGGVASEVMYFSNVMLNIRPIGTGTDGNANIEVTGEGNFSIAAIFSEQPA